MSTFKSQAGNVVSALNAFLDKLGVQVGTPISEGDDIVFGAKWCGHGQCFHIWLPGKETFVYQIIDSLREHGLRVDVSPCDDIGAPGVVQINGYPL